VATGDYGTERSAKGEVGGMEDAGVEGAVPDGNAGKETEATADGEDGEAEEECAGESEWGDGRRGAEGLLEEVGVNVEAGERDWEVRMESSLREGGTEMEELGQDREEMMVTDRGSSLRGTDVVGGAVPEGGEGGGGQLEAGLVLAGEGWAGRRGQRVVSEPVTPRLLGNLRRSSWVGGAVPNDDGRRAAALFEGLCAAGRATR